MLRLDAVNTGKEESDNTTTLGISEKEELDIQGNLALKESVIY